LAHAEAGAGGGAAGGRHTGGQPTIHQRVDLAALGLILVGLVLLPGTGGRLGLGAVVAFNLGQAALRVAPAADASTTAVNVGLALTGVAAALTAALRTFARERRGSAIAGAALVVAGAAAAVWQLRAPLALAGSARTLVAVLGIGAVAAGLALAVGLDVRRLRSVHGQAQTSEPAGEARIGGLAIVRASPGAIAAIAAGTLAAAVGPHVGAVFGGVALAALAGVWLERGGARGAGIAAAAVTVAALGVAYWLLDTIAGPVGLALAALPEVPLSDAAERLLALPLAGVTWLLLGLWPLPRRPLASALAPAGVALWARVAAPALPDGIAHWQPLVALAAVAGLWHGAVAGRTRGLVLGLALLALACSGPTSAAAAVLLVIGAIAADVGSGVFRRAGVVAAGLGMLLAFEAGLRAQVVFTVLAAVGMGAGWRTGGQADGGK